MGLKRLFHKLLSFANTVVESVELMAASAGLSGTATGSGEASAGRRPSALRIVLHPSWRTHRCGECGRKAHRRHGAAKRRTWRHLGAFGTTVEIVADVFRVVCFRCGVRTMAVPWARLGSVFTRDFEDEVAWFAQRTDRTATAAYFGISWPTVGKIAERVVQEKLDVGLLKDVEAIGVDEIYYGRPKKCLTVVVDLKRNRVIWSTEGRKASDLAGFFRALGLAGRRNIRIVAMDMSSAYRHAVKRHLRKAEIVYDCFHVVQLASRAVDEVRRELAKSVAADPELSKSLKRTRWALLKNPWILTASEQERLSNAVRRNKGLYRAYLIRDQLLGILGSDDLTELDGDFKRWYQWARRSKLEPIKRLAKTIDAHWDGIRRYITHGFTNAMTEGFNSKIRLISHRSYGLHSADSLRAMIFLCCSGIKLAPIGHGRPIPLHTL